MYNGFLINEVIVVFVVYVYIYIEFIRIDEIVNGVVWNKIEKYIRIF